MSELDCIFYNWAVLCLAVFCLVCLSGSASLYFCARGVGTRQHDCLRDRTIKRVSYRDCWRHYQQRSGKTETCAFHALLRLSVLLQRTAHRSHDEFELILET